MIGLFVNILAVLLASAFVMIIHELMKSFVYVLTGRHCQQGDKRKIFRLTQYIDPVGWILFLTCNAGFSRPYMYRLKEKDTNAAIGLTGLLTLLVLIFASFTVYWVKVRFIFYDGGTDVSNLIRYFAVAFNGYVIFYSISLFIVNLVPTITSDMALLIIAISPKQLISLARKDMMIKGILLLAIIFQGISQLSYYLLGNVGKLFGVSMGL